MQSQNFRERHMLYFDIRNHMWPKGVCVRCAQYACRHACMLTRYKIKLLKMAMFIIAQYTWLTDKFRFAETLTGNARTT